MGLDQYAYAAAREGQLDDYWSNAQATDTKDYKNPTVHRPRELAYWRKHPNLQGWMQRLWISKGCPGADTHGPEFNGAEVELTWQDLEKLENDVRNNLLPQTVGFFFGQDSSDHYREQDLEFIKKARAEMFLGLRVFYNSSW